MANSFCIVPWTSVHTRPDGFMAPCCHFQDFYRATDGQPLHLSRSTLGDGFRSEMAERLRQDFLAGRRDERCRVCWDEERVGQKSKRQHELYSFSAEANRIQAGDTEISQPIYLDLSLGKICNLKCRICSANVSSSWEREAAELGLRLRDLPSGISRSASTNWIRTNPAFWSELESWLPQIREFNFVGGEPFLSREHFALLKKSVEQGHAGQQTLRYNTNGTVYPEEAFRDLFPHFRRVQIWVSADDIGPRFEYQRHGARWPEVQRNIERIRRQEKINLAICLTISPLNIFYLLEALDFWLAEGCKVFLSPAFGRGFGLSCLPSAAKVELLERLRAADLCKYDPILLSRIEPFMEKLKEHAGEGEWSDFLSSLRVHDEYRQESYAATFPEAARFYGL